MAQHEFTQRLMTDTDFIETIRANPSKALAEYDVSDEVLAAIESGDETRIRSTLGQELEAGVPNASPPDRA